MSSKAQPQDVEKPLSGTVAKPPPKPLPKPETTDPGRTVPGADAASLAASAEDEDERETLRAPPRLDQTPTVVPTVGEDALRTGAGRELAPLGQGLAPPPQPIGRVALRRGPPRAAPPPLPNARAGTTALALDGDTVPATSGDADDEDDTSPLGLEPAFVSVTEIKIPPLPMPKDMVKLLELESSSNAPTQPPASDLQLPTYGSTLSPAERAARKQEPRRGRVLAGLAIAAAGAMAIGLSVWWQPIARPIVPKRAAATARVEATQPSSLAPTPAAAPVAPVPATPEPHAVTAVVDPKPLPQLAPLAPLRTPRAGLRKRAPVAPKIDPATLPESPSRQGVIDAMSPLREAITRCSEGRGGVAEIMLSVASSGAVLNATIVGDYAGTAQGSCIALAARKARFAPFQQARFSVRYPVAL